MEPEGRLAPLRVMQWNVLADGLAQFGDFCCGGAERVPADVLGWGARGPKLVGAIVGASADVVCLQEVNHFEDFFLPELRQRGYDGTFVAKKLSPALQYGCSPDGCAIFYRTSRLQLVQRDVVLYPAPPTAVPNQGAIACRFRDIRAEREFLVATTHLKAKVGKENEQRRLSQAQSLMDLLVDLTGSSGLPCVVCGDFNAPPDSEVYDFVRRHPMRLKSVYACRSEPSSDEAGAEERIDWARNGGASSEPAYTTWKFRSSGEKKETIDYIWMSEYKALRPSSCLRLPSEDSLGGKGLPTSAMPSDHLPLLCEAVWT
ncbi:nocturnin [Marchantia polymorpha subsp. ruderalis]|uniref:Endonuclease/exonuclease/phosphatase domain-containing protein n=2 Tax=Marchantia polymorpha TaxID=3197 RepID=A0AAF6BX70_MARPO|nr:hypothetical protein MARPO_0076s0019 [Marchantia polymorpha]BBN16604.1 hypothetical protein Mp_7g07750 [Marchantia polymorpha subsp. ruderalis]|eukprot:PTQ34773.1 hypothetical protein MARPO_0076s0019 [Marchantia polymorpha]